MLRILKQRGLLYLIVPSNGSFHRYPVDCWRFYPNSASALVRWAKRSGYDPLLLESFTGRKGDTGNRYADDWNDFVAVFLKDAVALPTATRRILDAYVEFDNGYVHGRDGLLHAQSCPEGTRNHFALLDEMKRRGARIERKFDRDARGEAAARCLRVVQRCSRRDGRWHPSMP